MEDSNDQNNDNNWFNSLSLSQIESTEEKEGNEHKYANLLEITR